MTLVDLDTEAIRDAAKNMHSKGSEIEAAVQNVDQKITGMRSFKSPRIMRDIDTWDSLKNSFKSELDNLLAAADELAAAAQANEDANV